MVPIKVLATSKVCRPPQMLNSGLAVTDPEAPLCRVLIEPWADYVCEAAKIVHYAPHGGIADARDLRENWNRATELAADLLITCCLPLPRCGVSAPVFQEGSDRYHSLHGHTR